MSSIVSFRASERQVKLLKLAEQMTQKAQSKILIDLIERDLALKLKMLWQSGVRPSPFKPPFQRLAKRKAVRNAADDSS